MREEGIYWIKLCRSCDWQIAHFHYENGIGKFTINENIYPLTSYDESVIFEICENRIIMEID